MGGGGHLGDERSVDLLQHVVHLQQLGPDQGAAGPADVADVVQAQVVQDQDVPVVPLQGAVQVAGHVVVHLLTDGRTPREGEWGGVRSSSSSSGGGVG